MIAGEETAVNFFNDWTAQVKAEVPADRLLVWEVKEGWEPLCQFMGVPVPDQPFPRLNDTEEQQARLRSMKRFCVFAWTVFFAGVGSAAYCFQHKLPSIQLKFN